MGDVVVVRCGNQTLTYRGKWYEFYALLALLRLERDAGARWLDKEELSTVGLWLAKSAKSAGKEISRHINETTSQLSGPVLEYKHKTSGWRLTLEPKDITWIPSLDAVSRAISARGWGVKLDPDWIKRAVTYIIKLNKGRSDEATSIAETMLGTGDPAERAIATLFLYRALTRAGNEISEAMSNLVAEVKHARADPFYRSVALRIDVAGIYQERFDNTEQGLTALGKMLSDAETPGDLATQASVMNAMAVFASKIGRFEQAEVLLVRAIRIATVVSDLYLLQAGLFNYAHALYLSRKSNLSPVAQLIFALLDAECELRDYLDSGKDNIQTEVLGMAIAVRLRSLHACERYIDRVNRLLTESISAYDQACYHRVRAKYVWIKESALPLDQRMNATMKGLRIARRLFYESGHKAEKLDEEIARTDAGLGPLEE